MIKIKDLVQAGYEFTQKLVFEYPFIDQGDLDNETLLTNPSSIMLDIIEDGDAEDFISFIIEVVVPESDSDSSCLIDVYQRDMINALEYSDTIEEFRNYILNV